MRITQALRLFQRNLLRFKTIPRIVTLKIANQPLRAVHGTRWVLLKNRGTADGTDTEDDLELTSNSNYLDLDLSQARDLVYGEQNDQLLGRIYDCVSVQELFNVYQKNANHYGCTHLLQSVLVLYDLKSIYVEINGGEDHLRRLTRAFVERLNDSETFQKMLDKIRANVLRFDVESLGFMLVYLNKLGMPIGDLQELTKTLEAKLLRKFSISAAAKFLEAVFSDYSLSSYFMCQRIVPGVLKQIDSCCSLKELEDLTVALNKLHIFLREEDLAAYKEMIEDCIDSGRIRGSDYKLILKVLSLLNYPKWREKNTFLMSKCILLTKSHMSVMNVNQLLALYEIFFKIQGPASVLNELQRCSSRFLLQLEDTTVISKRLDLLSSVIYFSPPKMRNQLRNDIGKYLNSCNSLEALLKLRIILSALKLSDPDMCKHFWDKVLRVLKNSDPKDLDLVKLSMHYVSFDMELHYRHEAFEKHLLKLLKTSCVEPSYAFFPAKLSAIASFALLYCDDGNFLDYLVGKLEENWTQLNRVDTLKISTAIRTFNAMSDRESKQSFAVRLDKLQDKIIEKEVYSDMDLWKNNALIKCCVFKGNVRASVKNRLLLNYRGFKEFSTKDIENVSFSFLATNAFIPEVMERLVEYAVKFKDHLHGFSLERILYLCYSVGYSPSSEDFYTHAIDIIIRDQGRMTGLALIHCALALCFFHRLPDSLIKTIFSIDFMERLEMELDNCYSKDRYPMRVRQNLMFLNRGVCLDYPESNVRWFHEKSMKEITGVVAGKHQKIFPTRVREYLMEVVGGDKKLLEENVVSPYGYPIDFVVSFDKEGKLVPNSSQVDSRLAILLIPQYAYTEIYPQLRGKYQMQKRHLEILGYKVAMLNYTDWISLSFAGERISFLRALIWPKPRHLNNINSGFS